MPELQTTWSWLPAIYLFLGGLSAGAFLTVSLLRLAKPGKFQKTVTGGTWIAFVALACGLLALVSEVEKPFQAMVLFKSFVNFSSWMAVGAWLLLVSVVVFGLSAIMSTDKIATWLGSACKPLASGRGTVNRVLAVIGIPCSLAVAVYTGILLGAAPAIPLWNTWLLPALFTVSALDTGVAAVAILSTIVDRDEQAAKMRALLEKCVIVLVVAEAAVLAGYLLSMQGAGADEAVSVELLLSGPLSLSFWALVVAAGLCVPLVAAIAQVVLDRKTKDRATVSVMPIVGGACALVGGFTLRFVVLAAGVHAALVSPAALQAAQGIMFFVS